jgi:hypothetical protein
VDRRLDVFDAAQAALDQLDSGKLSPAQPVRGGGERERRLRMRPVSVVHVAHG